MLIRFVLAAIALAGVTAFAPVPLPKTPKVKQQNVLEQLQGDWEMVSTDRNLRGRRLTSRSTTRIRIEQNRWSYLFPDGMGGFRTSTTYSMLVNDRAKPAQMDLKQPTSDVAIMRGIISIDGDQLKFCYALGAANAAGGSERPIVVEPVPENAILMTLKRISAPASQAKRAPVKR